jgi:hypothetical protein
MLQFNHRGCFIWPSFGVAFAFWRCEMDRWQLKARLKDLEVQRYEAQMKMQQAAADMQAISGAIQEVNYWLGKLEKEAEKDVC